MTAPISTTPKMADDDFADFESAQSTNTGQKEPQMIPSFTAFEIPPLDFDDDFNQDFTTPPPLPSSSSKSSSTGAPGDLFSLPPPLSALTDSIPPSLDPLPPSLDLDPLPSFDDIPPPLPPVGVSSDFTPSAGATSTSGFVADFSNFSSSTEVNIASSSAGNEVTTEGESIVNKLDNSFGSFNEVPVTTAANENPTSNGIGDDDFANFASFSEAQFPPPPPPLTSSDADPPAEGDGFSNFASFSDPPALTSNTDAPLQQVSLSDEDGFSNFASFSDAAAVPEATLHKPKAMPTVPDSDDFDEFTSFSDNTVSQGVTSTAPPPLSPDDDFGDFGSFDSVPVAPPPAVAPPLKATAPPINNKEALAACFPSQSTNKVSNNNIKTIKDCLSSDEISNKVWSQLNDKAECTRFFFQWSTSFLKDRFYTAVRVDPMLAPAVGSKGTSLLGDIGPLPESGGGAMMIDTGSFAPSDETPGTTLLDLSLPLSPSANEEAPGVSFDDFIGLSLNASAEGTQEQSKETTPTLWMDSELLELESESQPVSLSAPSSTTTDWLSRLTQTTTSVPSTTREEDGETEQKLVETKSSVYELLVSEGSSDMGWSFTMNPTGSNEEMSEPVIGKPSNSNTAIEPNTFMNNNGSSGVVQELSDPQGFSKQPALVGTGPLDNIGSFFENPLSFPVVAPAGNQPLVPLTVPHKQEEGSLDKGAAADVNQRAISLIKKLPQLDFMLSDKLMF